MVQNKVMRNLLIVEDELVIGNICRRVLTKEGFNVILATNGNMALQLLNKQKFSLFLLDIRTPGIDGVELYRHICEMYPDLSLKVIFMTGDSFTKNIREFVAKVECQLLEKPFTTNELLTAVRKL